MNLALNREIRNFGEKVMGKDVGEIVVYQPDDTISLEVKVEDENVWLNRKQLAVLFGRDVKTIGKHVVNALKEELEGFPVVANFATTASDGKTYSVEYYNLDVILSVGYRVKSSRGIHFRRWANKTLKECLLRGYYVNGRMERIEAKLRSHDERLDDFGRQIDFFIRTSLPPIEGVFFDGQIFDAYVFVADLIRSARQRLVLIDNYVDDSVLLMLSKRIKGVSAEIRTGRITKELLLDVQKHNAQYEAVDVTEVQNVHDRFLIVDETVFHIGASLKDLGKKLFAFSKLTIPPAMLLSR
jgi:hypothetical protein